MREKATKMGESHSWFDKLPKELTLAWRAKPLEASTFVHSGTQETHGILQFPVLIHFPSFQTDRISLPTSNSTTLLPIFSQQVPYGVGLLSLNVVRQGNTEVWHQKPPISCWNLRANKVLPPFLPSVTRQIVPARPKISKTSPSFLPSLIS